MSFLVCSKRVEIFFFTSLHISVLMKEMEEIVTLVGGNGVRKW